MTNRTTPVKITHQGGVQLSNNYGYCVVGGSDAVCFYIDPVGRAAVEGWTESRDECPVLFLGCQGAAESTAVELTEFKGWRVHCGGEGKVIAVALVRKGAEQ